MNSIKNELHWENIQYSIKQKKIINNVSGIVYSGELSCIMGPSGSGKTTLLNILSGRINDRREVNGSIKFNREKICYRSFRQKIAYVMQSDNISQYLTVKEVLNFSYNLRGSHISNKNKVEEIITILNLEKCKNTYIKNISGGEKKRVSIGIELVSNPQILFLDEPTSGLDSYNSLLLINNLKKLANKEGCMVLLTIHQPSSEIFYQMDKLILLKEGSSIFNGGNTNLILYFNEIGYHIPNGYNPADYILLKLQTESLDKLIAYDNIDIQDRYSSFPNYDDKTSFGLINLPQKPKFYTQLKLLSIREYQNVIRDRGTLIARFGISSLLNLLFALIFTNSGVGSDLMTHFGGIVQIAISAMFSSTNPTLLTFPIERPIFIREYYTGTYNILPYFFSKLIVELPLSFLLALLNILIRYWIMKLQGNFMYLVLEIWLLGLVSSSIALFLGSVTRNIKVSLELSPVIFVPQIMFAGFFIKMEQIPNYLRWAQYLCSLKFTINLMMLTEFGNCPQNQKDECNQLLQMNDVERGDWWIYLLILIALFCFFRLFSLYLLDKLSKTF